MTSISLFVSEQVPLSYGLLISSDKIYTEQAITSDKQALITALDEIYIEPGQMAHAGGRVYFPSPAPELDRIADEIINEIRTQYVIGYIPSRSKGAEIT